MEQKLNIAEILKDKPVGLKFYSNTFGYISFNGVHKDKIYFFSENTNAHSVKPNGKMCDGGECIIFPSKEMHDWSKFAWKKGDVLISVEGSKILFDKWASEDFTKFLGKIKVLGNSHCYDTAYYTLASEEEALEFIKSVEEINNGKLNRETLKIEKAQPEFKDGDIVCISGMGYLAYGIVKSIDYSSKKLEYYVLNDMSTLKFEDWLSFEDKQIQPITETQQIILFDALAKEGKAWDSEKKAIVNLKPKWTPKPFDRVITRVDDDAVWTANIFSHVDQHGEYVTIGCVGGYPYCIPYNEETAKLLGTTDDWKG